MDVKTSPANSKSPSPAWWAKLLAACASKSKRQLLSRSGRTVQQHKQKKPLEWSSSELTTKTAATVSSCHSPSSVSSLGGEETEPAPLDRLGHAVGVNFFRRRANEQQDRAAPSPPEATLRSAQEQLDLLQDALRVSTAAAADQPRQSADTAAAGRVDEVETNRHRQQQQRRRSRSPALPVRRSSRHRYDGDCCPSCDEAANAHAEEMYARATWRMYDRITRARAAAAAARAQQMAMAAAAQQHQGVPVMVAVPQPQQLGAHHRPFAALKVPFPFGVEEHMLQQQEPHGPWTPDGVPPHEPGEDDADEEERDCSGWDAVFSLDMDH